MSVGALLADLTGIAVSVDPERVRRASRDMSAVLSPVLASAFAERQAAAVFSPVDEEQVVRVAAACARHRVPLVPRGAGTGNFGQAVPLRGGIVLDLTGLTGVLSAGTSTWRARAGTLLEDIDAALRPYGREMRIFPSSKKVATVGGYVVGGHAGPGAVRHGVLADRGNLLGLRVVTLEEAPRALELRGDDVDLVHFSFGTAGIVTEVEMPATTACDWRDVVVELADLEAATAFGLAVALADGLDVKNVHPVDAGIAAACTPLGLAPGRAAALCMVAPHSVEGLVALAVLHGGRVVLDVPTGAGPRSIPLYEYTWGHSVWWLRKQVPDVTTVIALLPETAPVAALTAVRAELGGPVWTAVSVKRFGGRPALQLALCVDGAPGRLERAVTVAGAHGCLVADTHRPVLGHSSLYAFGDRQRAFKASVDLYGLCNPGKLDGVDAGKRDSGLSGGLAATGFSARRLGRSSG